MPRLPNYKQTDLSIPPAPAPSWLTEGVTQGAVPLAAWWSRRRTLPREFTQSPLTKRTTGSRRKTILEMVCGSRLIACADGGLAAEATVNPAADLRTPR